MRLPKFTILIGALVLSVISLTAQANPAPLTNSDVVQMVKAGTPEATIVNAITTQDSQFDLSSAGLQALSQAGVSSKIVRAMLAAESKKKDAATAAENSAAAPNAAAAQDSSSDTSSGASPQGMPAGMSSDSMAQMMANMPPEMRARVQAAMANRNAAGRPGMGGPPARSLPPHAGVPVPLDSALYTSFERLKTLPGYRSIMTLETNDPKMKQGMAQAAIKPAELIVEGNTRQYVMHYQMPAMDEPGTIDDWEIRAVVQNGRAARLITSPAVPRLLKFNAEKAAAQLAMLDAMAANAIAHAAAEGPMGAIGAGMTAASVAMAHLQTAKALKTEKEMFSWQCRPVPQNGGPDGHSTTQLTDFHPVEDQVVDGRAAAAYEFFAYDNQKTQGTVRLLVAKDTGLPLRINMGDPNAGGGLKMEYSELSSPVQIEIPSCMAVPQ